MLLPNGQPQYYGNVEIKVSLGTRLFNNPVTLPPSKTRVWYEYSIMVQPSWPPGLDLGPEEDIYREDISVTTDQQPIFHLDLYLLIPT